MAGVSGKELVTLPGWPAGINNVDKEHAVLGVPTRDGGVPAARIAENIDFDNEGKVARRRGYAMAIAGENVHSLWSHPELDYGLFVRAGSLIAFDEGLNETVITTGLSNIHPLSYDTVNGTVLWSSRIAHGRITAAKAAAPFALRSPAGQPTVSASTNGGLRAGQYQVAITYAAASGEESGTSLAVLVDVAEGQGVQLAAIPQPLDASVVRVRVYMTPPDGDVLYHQRDIPVGMLAVTLGHAPHGKPLETQWLQPMPTGQILRIKHGRCEVAAGNVLWWSEALRYGYRNVARNYIRFPDEITLLAPIGDGEAAGRYVAAGSRTYWISGATPSSAAQAIANPYGAVAGTHIEVPATALGLEASGRVAFWLASNGVPVIGMPGGQVMPLTDRRWVAPIAERGSAFLREQNGARHIVMGLGGQQRNGLRTTDRAVATVYRGGIALD